MSKHFECPVCLKSKNSKLVLECGHVFCRKCITEWSKKNKIQKITTTCPMCRRVLKEKKIDHRIYHRDKGLSQIMALIGF